MLIQQRFHSLGEQVNELDQRAKVKQTEPCVRFQKYFIVDVNGAF